MMMCYWPGWLEGLRDALRHPAVVLVGGPSRPRYDSEPPSWLDELWSELEGGRALSLLSLIELGTEIRPIIANVAAGYYFTPHTATPFGDLVFYLSTNLLQTIDGPSKNTVSLTPGGRTHLGGNWYLLMGVEVPVTHDKAFDYQVLSALMKVF